MLKKHFFNLYIIDMAAFDQVRLLHFKKYLVLCTLYSIDIEADKFCQTKTKDILDSENQN